MNTEVLLGIASALLAIVFEYIPKSGNWWENLNKTLKRLVMAGFLLIAAGGVYAMTCAGLLAPFNWTLTCDEAGLTQLISLWVAAVGVNTLVYTAIPKKEK